MQHQESGLHIAAWHGFPRIVELLCEAGASINLNNEEQETALHVAAARGHIECMRCLLDSQEGQAVIDSQDRRGEGTKETFTVALLSFYSDSIVNYRVNYRVNYYLELT